MPTVRQRHGRTDRQTDGRTDGRHTIAIPRLDYVHRAVKTVQTTSTKSCVGNCCILTSKFTLYEIFSILHRHLATMSSKYSKLLIIRVYCNSTRICLLIALSPFFSHNVHVNKQTDTVYSLVQCRQRDSVRRRRCASCQRHWGLCIRRTEQTNVTPFAAKSHDTHTLTHIALQQAVRRYISVDVFQFRSTRTDDV